MPKLNLVELVESMAYLGCIGIDCPEDASTASLASLISFIKRGNGTQGRTAEERIVLVQQAHQELIGKRVVQGSIHGRQGMIKYLLAKVPAQVLAMRIGLRHSGIDARPRTRSPFRVGVLWHRERQIRIVDLDSLIVL